MKVQLEQRYIELFLLPEEERYDALTEEERASEDFLRGFFDWESAEFIRRAMRDRERQRQAVREGRQLPPPADPIERSRLSAENGKRIEREMRRDLAAYDSAKDLAAALTSRLKQTTWSARHNGSERRPARRRTSRSSRGSPVPLSEGDEPHRTGLVAPSGRLVSGCETSPISRRNARDSQPARLTTPQRAPSTFDAKVEP